MDPQTPNTCPLAIVKWICSITKTKTKRAKQTKTGWILHNKVFHFHKPSQNKRSVKCGMRYTKVLFTVLPWPFWKYVCFIVPSHACFVLGENWGQVNATWKASQTGSWVGSRGQYSPSYHSFCSTMGHWSSSIPSHPFTLNYEHNFLSCQPEKPHLTEPMS